MITHDRAIQVLKEHGWGPTDATCYQLKLDGSKIGLPGSSFYEK